MVLDPFGPVLDAEGWFLGEHRVRCRTFWECLLDGVPVVGGEAAVSYSDAEMRLFWREAGRVSVLRGWVSWN